MAVTSVDHAVDPPGCVAPPLGNGRVELGHAAVPATAQSPACQSLDTC